MIGISLFVGITWLSLAPLISGWLSSYISLSGSNTHTNKKKNEDEKNCPGGQKGFCFGFG